VSTPPRRPLEELRQRLDQAAAARRCDACRWWKRHQSPAWLGDCTLFERRGGYQVHGPATRLLVASTGDATVVTHADFSCACWDAPAPAEAQLAPNRRCRYCRKPIVFVETTEHRWMPLDPEPNRELGNVVIETATLDGQPVKGVQRARVLSKTEDRPAIVYVSHFATCPSLPRRRKRGEVERRDPCPND
jgi:hypothetical protein